MNEVDDEGSNVEALVPWDMALRRAAARRRGAELLDRKDADQAIRALSEVEAYLIVKEVGVVDAAPLLGMLAPETIRALFDLDVWHAQRFDVADTLVWLSAFSEAGPEALSRAARALDPEALALLFRRRLLVALEQKDDSSDPDPIPDWVTSPPDEILPLIQTPDRRFIIAARAHDEYDDEDSEELDEEERKQVLLLVDELYKDEDWEYFAGMLRLTITDLSSAMEEDALRFRNARLEDLGFPPLERALEIYGPLDPARLLAPDLEPYPSTENLLPAAYGAVLAHGLFHEAMKRIESHVVVRRIEGDLVPMANAALVADGAKLGDEARVRETLLRMRSNIELALAHGVEPARRIEVGAQRLAAVHVSELFRIGYTLTLRIAVRARALKATGAFMRDGSPLGLLGERDAAVIDALVSTKRPRFARILDEPGADADARRPFERPEDLDRVGEVIDDLESLAKALDALKLQAQEQALPDAVLPPFEERTAAILVATAGARALLGGELKLIPLAPSDLARLAERFGEAGWSAQRDAEVAVPEATPGASAVRARVREALESLAETLKARVGSGEIDPRFVGVVLCTPS